MVMSLEKESTASSEMANVAVVKGGQICPSQPSER